VLLLKWETRELSLHLSSNCLTFSYKVSHYMNFIDSKDTLDGTSPIGILAVQWTIH